MNITVMTFLYLIMMFFAFLPESFGQDTDEKGHYSLNKLPLSFELNKELGSIFGEIPIDKRTRLLSAKEVTLEDVKDLYDFTVSVSLNRYKIIYSRFKDTALLNNPDIKREKAQLSNLIKMSNDIKDYVNKGQCENLQLFTYNYIAYFIEQYNGIVELLFEKLPNHNTEIYRAYYNYFVEPYDHIQRLLTSRIMVDYFSIPSEELAPSTLQFYGEPQLGRGIFKISADDQYGVVRNENQEYLISPLLSTTSPNLLMAVANYNRHRGSQTIFYFYKGRLIENDILDIIEKPQGDLLVTYSFGNNKSSSFLIDPSATYFTDSKLQNIKTTEQLSEKLDSLFYLDAKEKTASLGHTNLRTNQNNEVVINKMDKNSVEHQILSMIRKFCSNKKYDFRVNPSAIIIPLPSVEDNLILSLLYLESLVLKIKENSPSALKQFIDDMDQYLSILPLEEEFTLPQQLTSAQSSLQYFEASRKELEQEIIADYAVDIAAQLSEPRTAQESVEARDDIYQIKESLKEFTLKKAEEKTLEKEAKRQLFKQRQYWKNLAARKVQPTNEEDKILKQANEQLRHKKTLFKYTTQESINREAKRSNAIVKFKSAAHGYVTLKYKDGRADKKILLSNHTDKSMPSVFKIGAHALGHKFRNLAKTQRQNINQ